MDDTANPHGPFFMRFNWPDEAALEGEIKKASRDLARAKEAGDPARQLEIASVLGNMLTTARQEAASVALLEWALPIAYEVQDKREEAGLLLNLATAKQYLGERGTAQVLYQQAQEMAVEAGLDELEAFIQHHRGRCYAEQDKIAEARLCFERALTLRQRLGSPRAVNSQKALDLLAGR